MARLGSVLGGMLAELARARAIADELSREFVSIYREDPILSSMSVPRVVVDEAALTLRFSVSDLEELPEEPPEAEAIREGWVRVAAPAVLPRVVARLGVPPAERPAAVEALVEASGTPAGSPRLAEVRKALAGDREGAVAATARPLLSAWESVPSPVRSSLGTKAAFQRELELQLSQELEAFVDRRWELEKIRAALNSRIDVAIRPDELPADPGLVQEFRITVRGDDVEVLLKESEDGG